MLLQQHKQPKAAAFHEGLRHHSILLLLADGCHRMINHKMQQQCVRLQALLNSCPKMMSLCCCHMVGSCGCLLRP